MKSGCFFMEKIAVSYELRVVSLKAERNFLIALRAEIFHEERISPYLFYMAGIGNSCNVKG